MKCWTCGNGEIVTFGSYEQDNDLSNGAEPIEWIVLDVRDGKSLLISRYGLDCQPYHTEAVGVTWETCSLRGWLNGEFLTAAFTAEEISKIVQTEVDNSSEQGNQRWIEEGWVTEGGANTLDRVFLLSFAEAQAYFQTEESRICEVTEYAFLRGANQVSNVRDQSCWWLRSPGNSQSSAAHVSFGGDFGNYGYLVTFDGGAVRPVLWLDLDAIAS